MVAKTFDIYVNGGEVLDEKHHGGEDQEEENKGRKKRQEIRSTTWNDSLKEITLRYINGEE